MGAAEVNPRAYAIASPSNRQRQDDEERNGLIAENMGLFTTRRVVLAVKFPDSHALAR